MKKPERKKIIKSKTPTKKAAPPAPKPEVVFPSAYRDELEACAALAVREWQQQVWVCEEEGVQAGLDAQGVAAAKLSEKVSYCWLWQRSDGFAGKGCAQRMGEAVQQD